MCIRDRYPHYFNFLFDSEYLGIQIKETEITWNSSFTPFEIFVTGAKRGMRELNIDEKELRDDLLVMWAAVHGLAAMANMKGVQYDSGDWGALTERLLLSKVMPVSYTHLDVYKRQENRHGNGPASSCPPRRR